VIEPHRIVSELHAFVLGAAPGTHPLRSNDEVADKMIDTAEFLELMGYVVWELRFMATRWRWGEPTRGQYNADVAWLRRQTTIAFEHMKGDRTEPLMIEPAKHIDHTAVEMERSTVKASAARAAHASRRTPEYQLNVLEKRWVAAMQNARELVSDAVLLEKSNRLARAFAIACFALEEMAKVFVLITPAFQIAAGEPVDYEDIETSLRSHTTKWSMAAIGTVFAELGVAGFDAAELAKHENEINARLSARRLRELALYTDYRHGQVSEPSRVIDQGLVDVALRSAQVLLADLATLVDGLRGISGKYSSPMFHDQVKAAATEWVRARMEVDFPRS
jgi:AbiV family abortive infection protein